MEYGLAGFRPAIGLRVRMNAPTLAGSVVLISRGYPRFASRQPAAPVFLYAPRQSTAPAPKSM